MSNQSSPSIKDIGGDVKGILGDVYGGDITFVIANNSEAEIHSRKLKPGSPYLGLSKFEPEDKDKFFGREQLITKLSKDLEQNNLLLLVGASGSGKSSLVQAGIIPYLSDEWGAAKLVKLIFLPYKNPFESLYNSLPNKYKNTATEIINQENNDGLIKLIDELKENSQQGIIFIDQFEEIFTLTPKLKRDQFIANLVSLMKQLDRSVKLIIAMRSDFLDNLRKYGDFTNEVESKIRLMKDMTESELRLAIAEPAARNGVTFEKGLVEQIISDLDRQAGPLPLLQYTLDLLWEKDGVSDENRVLNIKTYDNLGGVFGALEQQANKIYEKFNDQEKEAVNRIFLELIDYQPWMREPGSRRTEKSQFEKDSVIKSVLNKLIENRLLVSGQYKSTVEVAHEQLFRSWKVLQDLIHEKEEIIILRSRLISDAKQWNELRNRDEEKAKDELYLKSKLKRVLELINKQVFSGLDDESEQFIQASVENSNCQEIEQEVQNNVNNASHQLLMGRNFDALISSLRAGVLLKKLSTVKSDNLLQVLIVLQQAVYGMKEYNRLAADDGDVIAVSFSPDGRLIALGTRNNTIKLWKNDGSLKTLKAHLGDVETITFSPDGKLIASASRDNTVKLWKHDGTLQNTLEGHEYPVEAVAFSPNGELIASASSDNTVKLWKHDGTLQKTIQGHSAEVIGVCFSPDGQTIASASRDRTVKIWSVDGTLRKILKGHKDAVYGVVFSPDGKQIASSSWDKTVKLWSLDGICRKTLKGHDKPIEAIAFSPDGQIIVSGSKDKTVKLWKLEDISPKTLKDHKDQVYGVVFSPDGQTIVTAGKDGIVKFWNIDGICRKTLKAHEVSVLSICFSSDGQTIVTAGKDGTVKLWSLDGTLQKTFQAHDKPVEAVAFSPDGELIATASRDKTVKLWRCHGSLLKILNHLDQHKDEVKAVNFSPDGKLIATASRDRTVKLWKRDGTYLTTIEGHNDSVLSVCFSPDSQTIASASCDNLVKLWSIDGACLDNLRDHKDWVFSVVFSPDGELIATASSDKTVKLWKRNGTYLTTLEGHNDSVLSVCFSPDGKIVASAGKDKKVILWNLDLDDLLVHGCNWVRDYLKTNLNVSESDRHLCDGIGTQD